MSIEVSIDKSKLVETLGKAGTILVQKAIVSALNKTMSSVRTRMIRYFMDELAMKRADVASMLTFRKATKNNPAATIYISDRGIPMIQLKARAKTVQTTRGKRVGVTAVVNGTRQLIDGAFIATMPSGHVGVFQRAGDDRLPIREVFSSKLSDMFTLDAEFQADLNQFAEATFQKNFDHDVEYFMSQELK